MFILLKAKTLFRAPTISLILELISEAKKLTLIFDRWKGDDLQLRQYTLDKTSEMRGSKEGQEGLSSFIERRNPDWKDEKQG